MIQQHLLFLRQKTLPIFQAAEAAECGLVCMAMVASYHGHNVDLNGLRQRYPVSMAGASLSSLITLGDEMGFACRALKVELSDLPSVIMPAILHWDLNHFVVLKSIRGKHAVIHDPDRGLLKMPLEEVSHHFTGILLELTPTAEFRILTARSPISLSSLWSKLHGLANATFLILILSIGLQIASFAAPFQLQLVVDEAIGHNDADLLAVIAIGFAGIIILQSLLMALRDWTLQLLGNQLVFQMVGNIVHHLLRLPSSYFEKRHIGDIISRLGSTKVIQEALTHGLAAAVIDGLMAAIAGIILFIYAPVLAIVVIASLILLIIVSCVWFPIMRARTEEMIMASAAEQSHLMESVRAATTIKLMGREAEREGIWRNLYSKSFNAGVSLGRFQVSLSFLQTAIVGVQSVLIIFLGSRQILMGDGLSIGMLMAFLSFRQTFTDRSQSLLTKAMEFQMLHLHLDRLGDIVSQERESRLGDLQSLEVHGQIDLTNMSFRYAPSDPWIFQHANLSITPGEFVAIVGPSGGGKTTLLKLLMGLQSPEVGQIRLDGQLADSRMWKSWRRHVGIVSQDDRLLSGSLADNISFFDPELNMQRVYAAADAAQIHCDIMNMPMKYLTLIGDMGSSLSGGQRQRVLLARALYRQPRVLILDEGTANLDPETEVAIADLLSGMKITRIVVAHRPALIQRSSKIITVANGSINYEIKDLRNVS